MRVNTNVSSLVAYRNLSNANSAVSDSMAKLSTGFRINKAADDAAGLGIANKLRADNRALTQASRNAEQANSVLQIAEGATGTIQKMLERMKELATQAGSDSVDDAGRGRIKAEYDELQQEIGRTVSTTKFQGKTLLDGGFGNSVDAASTLLGAATGVQKATINGAAAGAYTVTSAAGVVTMTKDGVSQTQNVTAGNIQTLTFDKFGISLETTKGVTATSVTGTLTVTPGAGGGQFLVGSSGAYTGDDTISLNAINLGTGASGLNLSGITLTGNGSAAEWQGALTQLDSAIGTVSSALGQIGAKQNRIGYAQDNLKTTIMNFSAAESVIRDLDMAEEMTKFSKNNIIAQAANAMLAQANQSTQGVLQLLRG